MQGAAATDLIQLEGVTKRFGGLTALDDVSFEICRAEVHAVLGGNGAGKSTLMKILAGVLVPDAGRILLRGEPAALRDPVHARRRGISIVFQELNLFPHLTVAGNLFVNRELTGRAGLLDDRAMAAETRRVFDTLGVDIDPRARVRDLTLGEKQLVEVARALQQRSDILILDEPNSALTGKESERLFEIVRKLREQGITVIYVSHRLEEVFAVADRVTVLRDGRCEGTWRTAETTIPRIVEAMIGRHIGEAFPRRTPVPQDAPRAFEVRGLGRGTRLGPVSFHVREGEIVGLAGLEGAGVDEVFHLLFGLERPDRGDVVCRGRPCRARSPLEAIRNGWGLIPANRREQGLMMDASIRENAVLAVLDRLKTRLGLVDGARERELAVGHAARLHIVAESVEKKVVHLSGGNQQKVVLAKWLATEPKVLLLNDPTRGVDVGAKAEIYELCHQLARRGIAILMTSSEVDEILGLCDRVLVLSKGRVVRECARGEASKADVVQAMSGGN